MLHALHWRVAVVSGFQLRRWRRRGSSFYAHVPGEAQDVAAIARLDALDASRALETLYGQAMDSPADDNLGPSI